MFRSAGILLAATVLLTSTALAQQRSAGYTEGQSGRRPLNHYPIRGPEYRGPGAWIQPGPVVMVPPVLGLLGLLLQPQAVVVAPVGAQGAPPPGYRFRHDEVPHSAPGPAGP